MALRFVLPLGPSTNNLFRNSRRGRARSPAYNKWREKAGAEITYQRVGKSLPQAPYFLDVYLYVPDDGRKRDASNFIKAPEDLLAEVFGFDDNDVIDVASHKRFIPEGRGKAICVATLMHSPAPDEEAWWNLLTRRNETQPTPAKEEHGRTGNRGQEAGAGGEA